MSARSSQESAALTSASSGRGWLSTGRSRSTPAAARSSRATSPKRGATRTSDKSARSASQRSTSSAVASPARTSARPAKEPVSTAPARVFGRSSLGSFASFDPATSSWRTCLPSSPGRASAGTARRSAEFSETWPKQGMTRSGRAYPLESSGHPTCESGSGSWPTPHGMPKRGQRRRPGPSGNELGRAVLKAERERFSAPVQSDSRQARKATAKRRLDSKHHSGVMPTDYVSLWPTPSRTDAEKGYSSPPGKGNRRGPQMLSGQVNVRLAPRGGLFTTPTASDTGYRRRRYAQGGTALSTQVGGQLNPTWVEWLMGFPLGWTALQPSAMPSSRRSPSGSGGGSSRTRS